MVHAPGVYWLWFVIRPIVLFVCNFIRREQWFVYRMKRFSSVMRLQIIWCQMIWGTCWHAIPPKWLRHSVDIELLCAKKWYKCMFRCTMHLYSVLLPYQRNNNNLQYDFIRRNNIKFRMHCITYSSYFFSTSAIILLQSPVPKAYPNQMGTCTLPRHPTGVSTHHWPTYGGTIAGVRHMPQVQISGMQTSSPPPPPSQIAMHHLNSRPTRHCIGGGVSIVDDEATAETPLMVKRESTVWL